MLPEAVDRPGVIMLLANLDGSVGGAQRQASLLARQLARRGVRVAIVNQSPAPTARHRRRVADGVDRVALPAVGWLARTTFLLGFVVWATRHRRQFQVIHAHSTSAGLTAGLVGRLLRKRVVVKVTGMQAVAALADRRPAWRLRRWVLERTADVLVAVSAEMLQALAEAGIRDDRCVLIPNGVDTEDDGDDGAAAKAAWLGDAPGGIVLYVGRLMEVKGVRALLPAWSAMARRDTATLLIVGDGPLRPELEREAAARGFGRSVRFAGSHPDVTMFYRMADVFVLPSLSEGLSNALLEAMAAGLPVVASDVGGNREVVDNGVSGFLVDWTDAAASARLVATLLDDAVLRRRVGEAARRRAGGFSIEDVAERYRALYQTVALPHVTLTQAAP
jgi:glycosyltransferase involved in cell wall biosynthesis